jgi:hypothetical protein
MKVKIKNLREKWTLDLLAEFSADTSNFSNETFDSGQDFYDWLTENINSLVVAEHTDSEGYTTYCLLPANYTFDGSPFSIPTGFDTYPSPYEFENNTMHEEIDDSSKEYYELDEVIEDE